MSGHYLSVLPYHEGGGGRWTDTWVLPRQYWSGRQFFFLAPADRNVCRGEGEEEERREEGRAARMKDEAGESEKKRERGRERETQVGLDRVVKKREVLFPQRKNLFPAPPMVDLWFSSWLTTAEASLMR